MTTTSQACARFEAQLPDYLEGTLPPAEQAEAARHAAGCAVCGPLAADLRAITLAAAKLPPLRPARDLWDGIAARIEPTVVPLAERRPGAVAGATPAARVTHVAVSRRWLAAAAAALVAVSAGVSWQVATRLGDGPAQVARVDSAPVPPVVDDAPERTIAQAPESVRTPGAPRSEGVRPIIPTTRPPERAPTATLVVAPAVAAAERTYDAEITELRRIVGERRAELDPATVAVLDRNLQVIDAAIAESKRALARDPASRFLGEQVTRAYDRKVQLLRTAALLPSQI